ncbi:MAG: alcohol dehydrogenase catalytic domain-containing protein [Desulfobacterales bacterium]|nr:alcohol dehydrogenase catalytic domain-containing protein [Desulfobacterales bacterium]
MMQAVVKESAGVDFVLKQVPIPTPKADEVLIRVEAVGLCGTDLPIFKGVRPVAYPLIPGHEFAGTVVGAGNHVADFKEGDRVVPGLVVHCGRCDYCRRGLESLCDGIYEIGIHTDGAFAQYVVAPEKTLHRLPNGLTFEQGASIDPIASAYRPVKKAAVGSGDTVVIFGPGPIGLYALQIVLAEGAQQVAVVGTGDDAQRLALARRLGADLTVDASVESPAEAIGAWTGGRMADVVIEATGVAEVPGFCLGCLKKAGRLSLAGIFHRNSSINLGDVVRREIAITGSICYTWLDFQACLDLVTRGRVRVEPLISHRMPLDQMAAALEIAERRESVKIIFFPWPGAVQ